MYPAFIELPAFARRWHQLGLSESDLLALQVQLGTDPEAGPVVKGAGLRKVRFVRPGDDAGKSGAYRVYYAHLPGVGVIVLAVAFGKGEASDIGVKLRKSLAAAVAAVTKHLRE